MYLNGAKMLENCTSVVQSPANRDEFLEYYFRFSANFWSATSDFLFFSCRFHSLKLILRQLIMSEDAGTNT